MIEASEIKYIWSPSIYIGNALKSQNAKSFGVESTKLFSIWFSTPSQLLRYSEQFFTEISCDQVFNDFPFDLHSCTLDIKNWIGWNAVVQLNSPKIFNYTLDQNGNEIGGSEITYTNSNRLDYDFEFKSLPSDVFFENGYNYSKAVIEINFNRTNTSRKKIFNNFYISCGTFAGLSLVSFFIKPDVVPGRMGLLITLYLILANSYASFKAPSKRGFSYLEILYVGTQTPILVAILEYGMILLFKKYGMKTNLMFFQMKLSTEYVYNYVDLLTFSVSALFQVAFTFYHWYILN